MAKVIKIGNHKPTSGNNVSHSKRRTKRTFKPNIVTKTMEIGGVKRKVSMPARMLKSLSKAAPKKKQQSVE
ncbi:MAG: bL28 family ribosomal protein [Patescibacteria group bacterium]